MIRQNNHRGDLVPGGERLGTSNFLHFMPSSVFVLIDVSAAVEMFSVTVNWRSFFQCVTEMIRHFWYQIKFDLQSTPLVDSAEMVSDDFIYAEFVKLISIT